MVRLFVGGLPPDINQEALLQRFTPFGQVLACELVPAKGLAAEEGAASRGFAYVELEPKDAVSVGRCLSLYNHSKWKGHTLRVEVARQHFMDKLKEEWTQPDFVWPSKKRKHHSSQPEDGDSDSSESWDGIPLPLDEDRPVSLLLSYKRRRPVMLEVPLKGPAKPGAIKRQFPPAKELTVPQLPWEYEHPGNKHLSHVNDLWELNNRFLAGFTGPASAPAHQAKQLPTADVPSGTAGNPTTAANGIPPPAVLHPDPLASGSVADAQEHSHKGQALAAPLTGKAAKKAEAAKKVVSAEQHSYLKVLKTIRSASDKEDAAAAAAAAVSRAAASAKAAANNRRGPQLAPLMPLAPASGKEGGTISFADAFDDEEDEGVAVDNQLDRFASDDDEDEEAPVVVAGNRRAGTKQQKAQKPGVQKPGVQKQGQVMDEVEEMQAADSEGGSPVSSLVPSGQDVVMEPAGGSQEQIEDDDGGTDDDHGEDHDGQQDEMEEEDGSDGGGSSDDSVDVEELLAQWLPEEQDDEVPSPAVSEEQQKEQEEPVVGGAGLKQRGQVAARDDALSRFDDSGSEEFRDVDDDDEAGFRPGHAGPGSQQQPAQHGKQQQGKQQQHGKAINQEKPKAGKAVSAPKAAAPLVAVAASVSASVSKPAGAQRTKASSTSLAVHAASVGKADKGRPAAQPAVPEHQPAAPAATQAVAEQAGVHTRAQAVKATSKEAVLPAKQASAEHSKARQAAPQVSTKATPGAKQTEPLVSGMAKGRSPAGGSFLDRFGSDSDESYHDVDSEGEEGGAGSRKGGTAKANQPVDIKIPGRPSALTPGVRSQALRKDPKARRSASNPAPSKPQTPAVTPSQRQPTKAPQPKAPDTQPLPQPAPAVKQAKAVQPVASQAVEAPKPAAIPTRAAAPAPARAAPAASAKAATAPAFTFSFSLPHTSTTTTTTTPQPAAAPVAAPPSQSVERPAAPAQPQQTAARTPAARPDKQPSRTADQSGGVRSEPPAIKPAPLASPGVLQFASSFMRTQPLDDVRSQWQADKDKLAADMGARPRSASARKAAGRGAGRGGRR